MLAGKPTVFVQVHRMHAAEGDQSLPAQAHQLPVRADRRAARGEAQHGAGLFDHLRGQQPCSRRAHLLVVFCINQFHYVFFASSSRISSNVGRLEMPP